jgi:hypothetical protein
VIGTQAEAQPSETSDLARPDAYEFQIIHSTFGCNSLSLDRTTIASKELLPKGRVQRKGGFSYEGDRQERSQRRS